MRPWLRNWFNAPTQPVPVAPEVRRTLWFTVALAAVFAIGQALALVVR